MSLADRAVHVVGITQYPDDAWILQAGRSMIDCESGVLRGQHYFIIDRDSKYTAQFHRVLRDAGVRVIRLPPMSPNLNAYAERFVRSIKQECLDRMIFVGQGSLRRAVAEYITHYHRERNHQGLENRLIQSDAAAEDRHGHIHRRQRLGGMLNYYYQAAA